jgi:hypothetical protein
MILSNTLVNVENNDIGLQFDGSWLLPFLDIGLTANFGVCGKIPWARDLLQI